MTFFGFILFILPMTHHYMKSLQLVYLFPHKILEVSSALGNLEMFSFSRFSNTFFRLSILSPSTAGNMFSTSGYQSWIILSSSQHPAMSRHIFSCQKSGLVLDSWHLEGRDQGCIIILQCMVSLLKQTIKANMSMACQLR